MGLTGCSGPGGHKGWGGVGLCPSCCFLGGSATFREHAPAVLRDSGGMGEGMGTGGIAARLVPLRRDGSPTDGGTASALHKERFVLGDARKVRFQAWMGVRVVADACGRIQGRDAPIAL